MIYNIVGDLLKQDKVDIICHQTNCKGVMGAGIAFQIKRTYPEVFKSTKSFVMNMKIFYLEEHYS